MSKRLSFLLLLLLSLSACGKQEAPKTTMLVGGLGASQLGSLESGLPDSFQPNTWDAYKTDLSQYQDVRIIIAHSFGCDDVCRNIWKMPNVQAVVFIDPVEQNWGDLNFDSNIPLLILYRTAWTGPKTAKVSTPTGNVDEYMIDGSHNSIPTHITTNERIRKWLDSH